MEYIGGVRDNSLLHINYTREQLIKMIMELDARLGVSFSNNPVGNYDSRHIQGSK